MASMNLALRNNAKASGEDPRLAFIQQQNGPQLRKGEKLKILGPDPDDRIDLLELMVALPNIDDTKVRIDQRDPTTRAKLADIKAAYQVRIEFVDDFVTILGERKEDLKAALTALRVFIDNINKDVQGKVISLTEHSIEASGLLVEIKPITSDVAPYRPITKKLPSDKIKHSAKDEMSTIPGQEVDVPQGLVVKFGAAISEVAERIRPVEGELRVRAHMGTCSLRMRWANQDTFSDDNDFKRFLRKISDKGWFYVDHKLGDEKFAQRLLTLIHQTEDANDPNYCKFVGVIPTILSIRDIKPKHCLILFAKDLQFEVDIKYEPEYNDMPTVENIRGYSCARRDKVGEIVVSCPNRKFDWHLAVEAEANAGRIPPEIRHFVKHGLRLSGPVSEEDFLVTSMDNNLLRAASVDAVACKISWAFEFAENPYHLEVSVYHEWGLNLLWDSGQQWRNLHTADVPQPIKSCGMMLYSPVWDDKMREINNPGKRQSDFANGFPELFGEGDLNLGVETFLQEMHGLHELTELATIPDQN